LKNIVITGGSSGIGLACVKKFLNEGHSVTCIDINPCSIKHKKLKQIICDVSNEEQIKASLSQIEAIDALIPSAAVYSHKNILDLQTNELNKTIDTNIKGVIFSIKYAIQKLIKSKGNIVLLASDQCFYGKPQSLAYGLTKGAIAQMMKSLVADYGDIIRVNTVAPGATNTPMLEPIIKDWADAEFNGNTNKVKKIIAKEHKLGRIAEASEIADAIYFLSSKESAYIQGVVLPIDGGQGYC
jgi:NAD(P)-dependent dehydrogenase (short-subunit alcohol dehydrogenase family)